MEQYQQPAGANSFGNKMASALESTKPPQLEDYVTPQLVIHQNPETHLTQWKRNR